MSLPACNPIDYGWFSRGLPIDHQGTVHLECKVCNSNTKHEKFYIVVGSSVGIGAPFFAKPFLKRSSTTGKLGGVRGTVAQCTSCNSIWPFDKAGGDALARAGLSRDGEVSLERMNEYRNRLAEEEERNNQTSSESSETSSRVRKFRD